jgi:hypothetical protein
MTNIIVAQQNDYTGEKDSTGLPGDDFSLQGALEMFKNAKTLEEFEQKLNTENNYVNNLDLNGDGKTDYVKVVDKTDGNIHAIVMQVPVNKTEIQDVAVIEIEKNGKESAMLQIIGDEELYGDSTIVEPFDVSEGKTMDNGPAPGSGELKFVFVNVWMWPCVSFIFAPAYVVWVSPWYYNYYPYWYQPWQPYPWYMHHNHCMHYYYGYHPVYHYRLYNAHNYYQPHRNTSVYVVNKYKPAQENYKKKQPYKTYNKQTSKQPTNNNISKNNSSKPNNNKSMNKNNYQKQGNNKSMNKNNAPKQNNNKNMNKNNVQKQNNNKSMNNNYAPKQNSNKSMNKNNVQKQNNNKSMNKYNAPKQNINKSMNKSSYQKQGGNMGMNKSFGSKSNKGGNGMKKVGK